MNRLRAAATHFAISATLGIASYMAVSRIWFPGPLFEAAGGEHLFVILLCVDVVIGPTLTFVVFKPGKPGLTFDLWVIGMLQAAALAYGLFAIAESRPVYVAFVKDRFELVHANNIPDDVLAGAGMKRFRDLPWSGPRFVGVRFPTDPDERFKLMVSGMGGVDIGAWPQYHVPYAQASREAAARAEPVAKLAQFNPGLDAQRVARERGIDPARVVVVKPGIPMPSASDEERAAKRLLLAEKFGVEAHVLVVVLLGRLVRRKGVAWFVEDVVPRLPSDLPQPKWAAVDDEASLAAAVAKVGSVADVRMLGPVDDDDREILLMGSDVVVMANIHVPGDMEGFGLVAVEAASRGAVVVAARIEGLEEAVIDGVTGILVEPENAEGFADAIRRLEANRSELRRLSNGFREQTIHVHSVERMFAELPGAFGLDGSRR